jgi:hypothetical protein
MTGLRDPDARWRRFMTPAERDFVAGLEVAQDRLRRELSQLAAQKNEISTRCAMRANYAARRAKGPAWEEMVEAGTLTKS